MTDKKSLNENELTLVSGGFVEEMEDIINTFRQHGYENEAARLQKAGAKNFYFTFKNILTELGFPYRLKVDASATKANYNNYNGVNISHNQTLEILNRFFNGEMN